MPSTESFEENIKRLSRKFSESDNDYYFVVEGENNLNKFHKIIKEYGLEFVVWHSYSNLRKNKNCAKQLVWQMKEIQPQKPFVVDDIIRKDCTLGPHKTRKTKYSVENNGHPPENRNGSAYSHLKKNKLSCKNKNNCHHILPAVSSF